MRDILHHRVAGELQGDRHCVCVCGGGPQAWRCVGECVGEPPPAIVARRLAHPLRHNVTTVCVGRLCVGGGCVCGGAVCEQDGYDGGLEAWLEGRVYMKGGSHEGGVKSAPHPT